MANTVAITVRIPNLRNGLVADIENAAPRASIPSAYKLAGIDRLAHDKWIPFVDQVIRAQYAQQLATVTAPIPGNVVRDARNRAIILGSVRAAAVSAYQLTMADLNTSECAGTGSALMPATPAVAGVAAVPAFAGHPAGVGVDAAPARPAIPAVEAVAARPERVDAAGGTAAGNWAIAVGMDALTADEVVVVNSLVYLGLAVPVLQGVSLTISGHHYLPTTRNVFTGTLNQVKSAGGAIVSGWIDSRGDDFSDMAFHKACHPINAPFKRRLAKDAESAARLTQCGLGAAAIRVPALPSDAQAGKAGVAVLRKASPIILGMGHTVTWANGEALVRAAEAAQEGPAERTAIQDILAWYAAHSTQIAFCAGIVRDTAEAADVRNESTLRAHSIRKLLDAYPSSVSSGALYSRAYRARVREQVETGTFANPAIVA